jgi:lipoprotein-anchoring transpeptidase ErfK/SrfK
MVYYRTVHPVGTIVVAKSQGFLHLVRPNVAAMRYTVGIGRACTGVAGLLTVSAKEDWSQSPAQTAASEPPPGQAAPGGARSRFGLRALPLSDSGHRIHGTHAATTAGDDGCFTLINDDIVDLYDRVQVGTRVVIN